MKLYVKSYLNIFLLVSTLFLFSIFSAPANASLSTSTAVKITLNGNELKPDIPPLVSSGRVLVPVRFVSNALKAQVKWDPKTNRVTIIQGKKIIKLIVGSKKAFKNEETILLDVPPQITKDTVVVPLRFISTALDVSIGWDAKTITVEISTGEPKVPEGKLAAEIPARIAFLDQNNLYLLGNKAGDSPKQITKDGLAQIIGWSYDGNWFAYLKRSSTETYYDKPYLYVVKADGTGGYKVDLNPVAGKPTWSPRANLIAYNTQETTGYLPHFNLKIALIKESEASIMELLPKNSNAVDFAWASDGQSMAVSFYPNSNHSFTMEKIGLSGEKSTLLVQNPLEATNSLPNSCPMNLKWSPQGNYIAYCLKESGTNNSRIQMLNLADQQIKDLAVIADYPQQLLWSLDEKMLTFLTNQQEIKVDVLSGEITQTSIVNNSYSQTNSNNSCSIYLQAKSSNETSLVLKYLDGNQEVELLKGLSLNQPFSVYWLK
ncbi:stalk domain-containing protein [Bacillota bacterium LX-D]|nr:stalk domain-containing protein [Bacillota bacterium LX-D]